MTSKVSHVSYNSLADLRLKVETKKVSYLMPVKRTGWLTGGRGRWLTEWVSRPTIKRDHQNGRDLKIAERVGRVLFIRGMHCFFHYFTSRQCYSVGIRVSKAVYVRLNCQI